jgi:energy-coupling factor transport system substrate-specific component
MLLPKNIKDSHAAVIYPLVCGLHGLLYGVLYAPAQALMFGLDFDGMIAWIVAGFPFDLLHAGGNLVAGFLVLPLVKVLKKLEHR